MRTVRRLEAVPFFSATLRSIPLILGLALSGLAAAAPPAEKPEPKKFETLTTTKSKTYKKVTVREVTPSGVRIFHESGSTTIHYEDLPADVQKELGGFDKDAAAKHRAETDAAATAQERALDEELKRTGDAQPAPAPDREENGGNAQRAPAADNPQVAKKDAGKITARPVGKRPGIKRIEVNANSNCPARIDIHHAVGADPLVNQGILSIEVEANAKFVREIWVYDNYSCQLFSKSGELLDTEKSGRKTGLDPENRPTLR